MTKRDFDRVLLMELVVDLSACTKRCDGICIVAGFYKRLAVVATESASFQPGPKIHKEQATFFTYIFPRSTGNYQRCRAWIQLSPFILSLGLRTSPHL